MSIIDTLKYTVTEELPLDSDTAQALKNVLPKLADDIDIYVNNGALPKEYIDSTLVPAMAVLGEAQRKGLIDVLAKNKGKLHDLASEVHASIAERQAALTFTSRKGERAQPLRTTMSGVVGTTLLDAEYFLKNVAGLQNDKEREESLLLEVFDRAKRVQSKFDNYVYEGDSKQYGKGGGPVQNWISGDDVVEFHGTEGKENARAEVEDTDKDTIEDILKMLTDNAKDPKSISVNFVPMGGENVSLGSKLNQLAEMASYLDALERGLDDTHQGYMAQLVGYVGQGGIGLAKSFLPSSIEGYAYLLTGGALLYVAGRNGRWKVPYNWAKGKIGGSTTTPGATPGSAPEGVPESIEKLVTIKGKEYYNPKSDSYKELETSIKSNIEKLKAAPSSITEAEANTRLAKAMRFLEEYKTKFLNGKPSYGVVEFGVKLDKIVKGETIIIPTDGSVGEKLKGTVKKATTAPIKTAKEAAALTREGLSGKGWNLNARMAGIKSAENLTAGNKNEPFKIGTDSYTFKGDHAEVAKNMKAMKELFTAREVAEKWEMAESELSRYKADVIAIKGQIVDLQNSGGWKKTTANTSQTVANGATSNNTSNSEDLTASAEKLNSELSDANKKVTKFNAQIDSYKAQLATYGTPVNSAVAFNDIDGKIDTALTGAETASGKTAPKFDKSKRLYTYDITAEKYIQSTEFSYSRALKFFAKHFR